MKAALLCTALFLAIAPACADEAIRTEAYSPQSRTSLVVQQGRVTNITFNVMERIKRIVTVEPGPISTLGKNSSNQEPLVNNLPIFGKSPGTTNMVVITLSPDGMERSYLFTIRVVPTPQDGTEDPTATFSLTFRYPKDQVAAAVAKPASTPQVVAISWRQTQAAKDKEIAEAKLNSDAFFGPQNLKYLAQRIEPKDRRCPNNSAQKVWRKTGMTCRQTGFRLRRVRHRRPDDRPPALARSRNV